MNMEKPGQDEPESPQLRRYYIDENGEKRTITHDRGFIGIRFKPQRDTKDQRRAFYKRIKLVVSEFKEPALKKARITVVRLLPGASQKQWDMFAESLRGSKMVDATVNVYSIPGEKGAKDLLVATGEIAVKFKAPPTKDLLSWMRSTFPLDRGSEVSVINRVVFRVNDAKADIPDIAEQLSASGRFVSAVPLFVHISGRKLSEADKQRVTQEYLEAAPEEVKEELRKGQQENGQQEPTDQKPPKKPE